MNGKEMLRQTTSDKQTPKHKLARATEQTDGQKCRQTLAAKLAKSCLSSNGNNANWQRRLDNVD